MNEENERIEEFYEKTVEFLESKLSKEVAKIKDLLDETNRGLEKIIAQPNRMNSKLNRSIYAADENFYLCPLADEDRSSYEKLRLQIIGKDSLFFQPECKDLMWEQVLRGKDKSFSVFTSEGDYCGNMELQSPEGEYPEIGIDLLEEYRNKGIAGRVIKLLAKRAYYERPVEGFILRVSSENSHSKHVLEKIGAELLDIEENLYKKYMDNMREYFPELDMDELKDKILIHLGKEDEIIYRYILRPEKFLER